MVLDICLYWTGKINTSSTQNIAVSFPAQNNAHDYYTYIEKYL